MIILREFRREGKAARAASHYCFKSLLTIPIRFTRRRHLFPQISPLARRMPGISPAETPLREYIRIRYISTFSWLSFLSSVWLSFCAASAQASAIHNP